MAAWRSNGRSSTSSRACFSKGESPMIYLARVFQSGPSAQMMPKP
jgi:hypothetical protein